MVVEVPEGGGGDLGGVGDHVTDVHLRTGVQGDAAVDASVIEEVKLQVLHKVAIWIAAMKREEVD